MSNKSKANAIIGVDVGGTRIRAARFDPDLNLLDRAEQPTGAKDGTEAVLERLYETIRQVLPAAPGDLLGIGLALPGPLDPEAGLLIAPPNLPFKGDLPIVKLVAQAVGGKVVIGNDADLAALAEQQIGAGRGTRHMVYITVSTGVGGGIIINGQVYSGCGMAGEIGHMPIDPRGPLCGCGRRGHLEAFAAGSGLAARARERLAAGEKSIILEMAGGDPAQITGETVGKAAEQGDMLAGELVEQAGRALGIGIASLMVLLNPEVFVVGGPVTRLGERLFAPMRAAIDEFVLHPRYAENTPIVPAKLGDNVGLIGAAALVKMRVGKNT